MAQFHEVRAIYNLARASSNSGYRRIRMSGANIDD
jgi:hypothetical protein